LDGPASCEINMFWLSQLIIGWKDWNTFTFIVTYMCNHC